MRHLWDKIDDTCKRCGLKRKLSYNGDGFLSKKENKYVYYTNSKWIKELPECKSDIKLNYEKLFDFNEINRKK